MSAVTNQAQISFISLGEDGLFAQFKYNGKVAYYDKPAVLHLLTDTSTNSNDRETLQTVLASFNSINTAFGS